MISEIRNIAISGHGKTGKSMLAELLLFQTATINHEKEKSKPISDFTDVEKRHSMSIYTALMHLDWQDKTIFLLDTPSSSDFIGEVISAFRIAESVIMMLSAANGIQIETIKLWRRLDIRKRPRMVFINKIDEGVDTSKLLTELSQQFSDKKFIILNYPIQKDGDFIGIYDLIEQRFFLPANSTAELEKVDQVPNDIHTIEDQYRSRIIETAAENDDKLLEKFLNTEELTYQEIWQGLKKGFQNNSFVPVFFGSCLKRSGILCLLNFIAQAAPSPDKGREYVYQNAQDVQEKDFIITEEGNPAFFVFKTRIDQFAGKLSYIKIMQGTLRQDSELINEREGKKERINKLYYIQGKILEERKELSAGMLGVMAKNPHAQTNDTYMTEGSLLHFRPLQNPRPVYSLAIHPESRGDEDKLGELLQRISEQDKTFTSTFLPETKQTVIAGMGDFHLRLILEEIMQKYGIMVKTDLPKTAYRETLTKSAQATYRHKKQSGGHGQFAEVSISIAPLERGKYYQFKNLIRGTAISRSYVPGIEKGLHEAMQEGLLAGYPVTDVAISLHDGKEHSVDSSELAFKIAAKEAFKKAMTDAAPILLDPIMYLKVWIEDQYLGEVLSDLSARRARIQKQERLTGNIVEIDALVPHEELLNYCIDLRSISSGTGSFEVIFAHYAPLRGKHKEKIIAHAKSQQKA